MAQSEKPFNIPNIFDTLNIHCGNSHIAYFS